MKNYKNILIYLPNWLGDIIMSYPVIDGIKKYFPNSKLSLLGISSMIGIFEDNPIIDKTIDIKKYKSIKKRDFDIIILFQNSFISAFNAFKIGAKQRIGYSTDSRKLLLTKHTSANYDGSKEAHTTDHYINMVNKILNINIGIPPPLLLPISNKLKERARLYLEKENILNKTIFAYGIGATNGFGKIWDEKHYAQLANNLHDKYNAHTLFVATANDKDTINNIKKHLNHEPRIPSTDLGTIAAILSYCKGFVGNDSGAMHLASAIGIPTIGLYFATPVSKNYPRGTKTEIIAKYMPCQLCSGIKCSYNDKTYECRSLIKPQEVLDCLESILQK